MRFTPIAIASRTLGMLMLAACSGVARAQDLPIVSYSIEQTYPPESRVLKVDFYRFVGKTLHFRVEAKVRADPANDRELVADSSSCPAVLVQLSALRNIELPSLLLPDDPAKERQAMTQVDGPEYAIKVNGQFLKEGVTGDLRLNAGLGSPVAAWIDATEAALKPCWTPVRKAD